MAKKITLIQISDLHIGATDAKVKGVDARQNLLNLLTLFKQQTWDLLIVSGDLAALNGEIEAYVWIKQQLDKLQRPYLIMAGNHDSRKNLRQIFTPDTLPSVDKDKIYYRQDIQGFPLFFLDTADNKLDNQQIDWLKQHALSQSALLFMHHPPIDCQCYFMDSRYPLLNRDRVWKQFKQLPQIKHIFCGHYHTAKRLSRDDKQVYICPSTINQINPLNAKYSASSDIPAWRVIQWDGQQLHSRTHKYLKKINH